MAEVYGIIAGAVSLTEIAVKASDKLLTLIHETEHAPEEIVALEDEMHYFRTVLHMLQGVREQGMQRLQTVAAISGSGTRPNPST